MTNKDQEIYKKIGQLLFDIAPDDAKMIKVLSSISRSDVSCELQYFYTDKENEEYWFLPEPTAKISHQLGEKIFELSDFYEKQKKPHWKGCEIFVNTETGKFRLNFNY